MNETVRSQVLETLNSESEVHLLCVYLNEDLVFSPPSIATPQPAVECQVTYNGDCMFIIRSQDTYQCAFTGLELELLT